MTFSLGVILVPGHGEKNVRGGVEVSVGLLQDHLHHDLLEQGDPCLYSDGPQVNDSILAINNLEINY